MVDEKIIDLFWLRSEEAITQTKNSYEPYCRAICSNILSNRLDTEECISDAYMKLWETIPPQRPRSLRAYLSKIVRNLALDRYRNINSEKRGGKQAKLVFEEIQEFISQDAEELADELTLRDAINSFLEDLDPDVRTVFVQRYWYFLSVRQIADIHGMGQSKVKMTLKRTRDKLKEHLQKEGLDI